MVSGSDRKAYVFGAGVTGLVTAWRLLQSGWQVDIYEKEDFYGGMARTHCWRDYLLDLGPHIFHTPEPSLADFWEQEFGDLLVEGEFWCKNVKGWDMKALHDYPLSHESIARYPAGLRDKILSELNRTGPDARARAKTFKEYVTSLVGPTLQQMFFEDYPRKLWGLGTEKMSATWAPKRIELRDKVTPFYHGQWNAVGRRGTGCIYDRIHENIVKLGGRVRLNAAVRGIEMDGNRLKRILLQGGEAVALGPEDVVVSTLPINILCQLLGAPCSLAFRGIFSVYLAFKREHVLPDKVQWLYFDSQEILFHRLSEQKKLAPECAPADSTCLTAEIAFSRNDRLDRLPADSLAEQALSQVCRLGLANRSEFLDASVLRQEAVYPLLYQDYQHELAKAKATIGRFQQIYSIGTTGEFDYADSQILFLKAFDLAEILSGKYSELSQVRRKLRVGTLRPIVSVNGRMIGEGHRPFVIAEAGLNHNGSVELARRLVDEAAKAGCDAIKFQTYLGPERISGRVKKVRYAETTLGEQETLLEMFQRLELSRKDQEDIFKHARQRGIEIFSTPFDEPSVDFLEKMGVSMYKTASFDLVNLPLLRKVASTGKPLFISTGMSTLGQIEEALETVRQEGNENVVLLHCVSAYPAAPEDMNLRVLGTLARTFRVPVGLSDHTLGIQVAQMALAVGAAAIERHFTLDRGMEGPDHILSSTPDEMAELVQCAALIQKILGDGVKKIEPCEYETINAQRRSLYARSDISKGQVITREMIAIKGPGGGLQPRYLDVVVGRPARKDIEADHPITWDEV